MKLRNIALTVSGGISSLLACALVLLISGCKAPGKPIANSEEARPEQVLDFPTLYKQNCAACHGESGRNGASISLSNPVYLAFAGTANIQRVISQGVPGTMMPPFGQNAGGSLTDQQVTVLAQGVVKAWSNPNVLHGQTPPPYATSLQGNPEAGQKAFSASCAQCHGSSAEGMTTAKGAHVGSLVDPAYLALVSDQSIRSNIVAGRSGEMPDWQSHVGETHALSDQEITDIVAWLTSHRTNAPGQPYPENPQAQQPVNGDKHE